MDKSLCYVFFIVTSLFFSLFIKNHYYALHCVNTESVSEISCSYCKERKKRKKSIYIVPFTIIHSKRSGVDHTVLPANNTTPAFPSWAFTRCHHSPPQQLQQQTSNCSSLLIYQPQKDERLSWPSWLTYSRWLTHISGHPSATSRAKDSESTSTKDQCSTAGPRNYHWLSKQW